MAISSEYFRLSQILQPLLGAMQGQNQASPNNMQEDSMDISTRMANIYSPENAASDRLNELINNMPQRNKPGIGRKIVAGIASLGTDPNSTDNVLYGPYHRQLADWKEQLNPAIQAANFERAGNMNERQLASMIAMQETRDRTFDRQTARDKVLEAQGNARIKQGDERTAQADRRIKQADARIEIAKEVAKGGQFRVNPRTGKAEIIYRDGSVKSVPSMDDATREEIAQLEQEFALERIEASGEQSRTTKSTPSGSGSGRIQTEVIDDPDNPGKRILVERDPETGEWKPSSLRGRQGSISPTTRTGESEANKIARINRMAIQIKNTNPKWAPYIQMKNGKFIKITEPGMFNRMTPEMYKEIATAIGLDETQQAAPTQRQVVQPTQSGRPPGTEGKIHVRRKSDGKTGWVNKADPAIYDVIK